MPNLTELKSRLEFGQFLNDRGLTGKGVEVGVLFGEWSASLLSIWKGTLYMVDPWVNQSPDIYLDGCNAVNMNIALEKARAAVKVYGDKAQFMQLYSAQAAGKFEDGSLDFVYLDGNHSYDAVVEDLQLWRRKVRAGGVLGGHDFYERHDAYQECGVESAVQRFAERDKLTVHRTPECTSWWIEIPAPAMVCALGVSIKDFDLAAKWLQFLAALGPMASDVPTVVVGARGIAGAKWDALQAIATRYSISVSFKLLEDEDESGYPKSASHLFLRTMEHCEKAFPMSAVLWCEPDTVPMTGSWREAIRGEYLRCGKPFMGVIQTGHGFDHLAGVAVYPADWRVKAPLLANVLNAPDIFWGPGLGQAFDTYATPETLPQTAPATSIQQIWRPTLPITEDFLKREIPVTTVLFHQCKDGSLIDVLCRRMGFPLIPLGNQPIPMPPAPPFSRRRGVELRNIPTDSKPPKPPRDARMAEQRPPEYYRETQQPLPPPPLSLTDDYVASPARGRRSMAEIDAEARAHFNRKRGR
jgi:hypothetical protein